MRGGGGQVLGVVKVIVLAERVPHVLKEGLVVCRQVLCNGSNVVGLAPEMNKDLRPLPSRKGW